MAPETEAADKTIMDPWIHRSKGMRCASCIWYVRKDPTGPVCGPNATP